MRSHHLLLTSLLFIISIFQSFGQITLSTQAEVDAWDQSIMVLTDDVIISGDDITNIDALSNLVDVVGILEIKSIPELKNIDGLSGLNQITGEIILEFTGIENIDGLTGLTDIVGTLEINRNLQLQNIDGLSSLENISGTLNLVQNLGLININALLNLTDFDGRIFIQFCDGLTNVDGFANLEALTGQISLWLNDGLKNIDAFSNLTDIEGTLTITSCNALENIDGLSNLNEITGSFGIVSNTSLELDDLEILSNLDDIYGQLTLQGITSLTHIDLFSHLNDISGKLNLKVNHNLNNLDGLSGITTLTGEIVISQNNSLINLNGLSNLTDINGALVISSNEGLINLSGLTNLTNINGELLVSSNPNLIDIDELSGININGAVEILNNDVLANIDAFNGYPDIPGELVIKDNDGLTHIDEFSSLTNLTGVLTIQSNIGLANIDGLSNLKTVDGILRIYQNHSLTNIDGLSGLTDISGRTEITANDKLNDISGISGITTLNGELYFSTNKSLTHVDGLSNLKTVIGRFGINRNEALENIDGLSGLNELVKESRFLIEDNPSLTNIDGLSNLINADGNLYIFGNDALTNLDGLLALTEISTTADIRIGNNNALSNIDGFSNITHIRRHLTISSNINLTNLNGFSQLEEISGTGHLLIQGNPRIKNLNGFSNLKRLINNWTRLSIIDNDSLSNINILSGIEEFNSNIILTDNDQLSACCILKDLIEGGTSSDFDIQNNKRGCDSISEILDVCSITINFDQYRPCEGLDNGSINFFASDYHSVPFFYEWEELTSGVTASGVSLRADFSIDNLATGTYNVTISLPNGAYEVIPNIVLDPIIGSVFEYTTLTSTNSTNGSPSGSIYLEYYGGTPPYDLSWSGTATGSRSGIEENSYTIFSLGPGEYTLQLTDANGQGKIADITLLDEVAPSFPCDAPLDIVILNDVSGSVNDIEYDESQTFFVDFLKQASIGEGTEDSQATIIEWASPGEQKVMIPLSGDIAELSSYEDLTRAFNGGTLPIPAMQFGMDYIEEYGRDGVEKAFILSTDGHPSESLIYFADQLKAKGYHIVTIAFDDAYRRSETRDILSQVASIPLASPGADSYAELDPDLADKIVNLYLCPLDPGSSSSVYFYRDGALEINSIDIDCPVFDFAQVTFTVSALRELSLSAGTSVMFYHNDPSLYGATPIMEYKLPCAIPAGTSETQTVTIPLNTSTKLYVLLNDDGSIAPPVQFPITEIEEIAYTNNVDTMSVCVGDGAVLQALKRTSTQTPICDSLLIYTIDVCNIGNVDANEVAITDVPPFGAELISTVVNTGDCTIENNETYLIPIDCCVSISLTYDATQVEDGFYGAQNVILNGPTNQEYLDYNGSLNSAEDVIIGNGEINCPSTEITFTKEVSKNQICDDGFLTYTFTVENQTNSVIHGAKFLDIIASPAEWFYKPYNTSGISISVEELSGTIAFFDIDEIPADTVATFQIDAYMGDWTIDGNISGNAKLENVIDLENGGTKSILSNSVSTEVYAGAGTTEFPCDWTNFVSDVEEEYFTNVQVYPNPTDGAIQLSNLLVPTEFKLYNSMGQVYNSGIYQNGKIELEYEGMNFIQLSLDGKTKTFKVFLVK